MKRVLFSELPWTVRIILGMAALNFWVSLEEFVIDRLGIWRYLPGYRYARFCVWDLTVALLITAAIWWFSTKHKKQ